MRTVRCRTGDVDAGSDDRAPGWPRRPGGRQRRAAGRGATGETSHVPVRPGLPPPDRKSTRLNSSHPSISYAVFCLKKKKKNKVNADERTPKQKHKPTDDQAYDRR